jgi:hypothetical protein
MRQRVLFFTALFLAIIALTVQSPAQKPMGVGGALEISLPMGDFGDAAGIGFGITGNFQYGLNPKMDLIGQLGYIMWGAENEPPGYDLGWSAIPFQAGLKYFVTPGDSRFYVGGMAGFHNFSVKVEYTDPFFGRIDVSDSELKFGLAPMGGYEYMVSEKMLLDFSARFQFVTDDLSYFGLRAGMIYKIR